MFDHSVQLFFPSSFCVPRGFVTGPRRPVLCGGQLGGSLARTYFFTSRSIFCFGPTVESVAHSLHYTVLVDIIVILQKVTGFPYIFNFRNVTYDKNFDDK